MDCMILLGTDSLRVKELILHVLVLLFRDSVDLHWLCH